MSEQHLCENCNVETDANITVVEALFAGSQLGDDALVQEILSRNDVNLNSLDCNGSTPLFYAMMFNNPSTVRIFLIQTPGLILLTAVVGLACTLLAQLVTLNVSSFFVRTVGALLRS